MVEQNPIDRSRQHLGDLTEEELELLEPGTEGPAVDDPTPEQIEQRSEEIRRRWSERVKKKRHLRAPARWDVPKVPVADIDFPSSG